ncbi:MAG TPA: CHAD domain-containing protein [Gemmatimonadales bacterium]|nr:CHAD domain-containing protein [Gemmatimonadales bacterium]
MADFSADLLERPAVQGACAVALAYLDDATAAAGRLSNGSDREALHAFRVAIRRLRVTVRAYPGIHESVPKKQRRRLRKLARATNPARDAEVQIEWFNERSARFTPAQRAALAPFRARLRARRRSELAHAQEKLQRWFGKLERKLRRRLAALQSNAGPHEAPFRAVAAATLVRYVGELEARLAEITQSTDAAQLHDTRIAAKRVRYLLEPLEPGLPDGTPFLDRLKQLQDLFGTLTDAHELDVTLQDEGPAVAAAAGVLHAEAASSFDQIRRLRPVMKTPRSLQQPPARRRRRQPA